MLRRFLKSKCPREPATPEASSAGAAAAAVIGPALERSSAAPAGQAYAAGLRGGGGDAPPLPPGPLGAYEQVGLLGAGTFGAVVLARSARTGELVAIKLIERGEFVRTFRTYVMRELLHHGSLAHPFVVRLREVLLLPRHLAIVMEYAAGGDLFRHLEARPGGRLPEAEARWVFQQLMVGLDYCHSRGVANRDLKLENLLLVADPLVPGAPPPMLKICDFGYSKHELNSCAKTGVGTPVYMAPEVIYGGNRYDAKMADLWSCGVVLYTLLYGQYPFDKDHPDYPRTIVNAQYTCPPDVPVSPACLDLLARLLVPGPDQRLCMAGIQAHPWFLEGLPPGATTMNEWYIAHSPALDQVVGTIEAIVQLASRQAEPGEPEMRCALSDWDPPQQAPPGGGALAPLEASI